MIDNLFPLVNVWTAGLGYIEDFYAWYMDNEANITDDTIIIGDTNSNAIWDHQHGIKSHSSVVDLLNGKGLVSAYHYVTGEEQGKETTITRYAGNNSRIKDTHIDHCFVKADRIKSYHILNFDWLLKGDEKPKWSDHAPLVLEISD